MNCTTRIFRTTLHVGGSKYMYYPNILNFASNRIWIYFNLTCWSTNQTHTYTSLDPTLFTAHTWLIKGWCLGDRFLLFTVMATTHWDYCHLTLLSESMFLLENIFQLIIYCSLCAAIVTGQNQNWKLMTIIKSFDFLQNVKTFYKKVLFFLQFGEHFFHFYTDI